MCQKACIRFQLTLSCWDEQHKSVSFCSWFLYNVCGISVAEWYAPISYITRNVCEVAHEIGVFNHISLFRAGDVTKKFIECFCHLSPITKYQSWLKTSWGSVLLRTSCSSFVTMRVTFSIFKILPAKSWNSKFCWFQDFGGRILKFKIFAARILKIGDFSTHCNLTRHHNHHYKP